MTVSQRTRPSPPDSGQRRTMPRVRRRGGPVAKVHPGLWLFPLPAVVLYVVFFAGPTLQAFQYSVTDWDGISAQFANVGTGNFSRIATGDDLFRGALTNNIKFLLVVVIAQTALSLLLALLLQRNSRSSTALRALFFLPAILSSVSVAFVWKFMYDPNFGLINQTLSAVGLDSFQASFLGNPQTAIYWVGLTQVWAHAGQLMVIFIAGLQQIPAELYEAAELDGAGAWRKTWHVTLPMLTPTIFFNLVLGVIGAFQYFTTAFVLARGGEGPAGSLLFYALLIYRNAFSYFKMGYASALSWLLFAFVFLLTFIIFKTSGRWVYYEGENS